MKRYSILIIAATLIVNFSVLSCSDSESKLSPLFKQTMVILNLGLPPENPSAYDNTIWNKIRNFFVREAVAQTAPASFSNILVRVSGPDIGVIEQEFGPLGQISFSVPAGSLRQFEVIAYVSPTDPSAAMSFRGTAIANLPEGETVSIPIVMMLNETRILAADNSRTTSAPYSTTGRVIMMNDMSGAGWSSLTGAMLGFAPGTFKPFDVSFDSRGRIYIANNGAIGMVRVDNINGTNPIQGSASIFNSGGVAVPNVVTVTVDRINNFVYFAQSAALFRSNLDGTNTQVLSLATINIASVRGMDVDIDGTIYITGNTGAGAGIIARYDPGAQAIIGTAYSPGGTIITPWDVMVRAPFIYVANFGNNAAQLLRFTFSGGTFSNPDQAGLKSVATSAPGNFFGTSRFLAIRNDVFIVEDSNQGGGTPDFDKIISFNDLSFGGWTTFGSYNNSGNGNAVGQFRFFSFC
jgi:hypothetical protein